MTAGVRRAATTAYHPMRAAPPSPETRYTTTTPIVAPAILDIPATNPITMTPREAQKLYGYDIPSEAHPDLRAKQYERVFEAGDKPSDEGLLESEEHIGGTYEHLFNGIEIDRFAVCIQSHPQTQGNLFVLRTGHQLMTSGRIVDRGEQNALG